MIPHPVTTRRGFVTNARNQDTTFKIVLSGKRNQRRRNTRITVLMMRRKRRSPQNLHQKSSKSSSHTKSSSKKARAFIGKEMDYEAESQENEAEEESDDSKSGVASLALATAFVSKSIFNAEESDLTNKADEGSDDYAPTYCFMAKGAKVLKYASSESSEDESDENLKPSYSKLAKIAVQQQKAF